MHRSKKTRYSITSSVRAAASGVMVSLVEPAKERLEEIRYDAAVARLDFRGHGHRELENMRVAPPAALTTSIQASCKAQLQLFPVLARH
jgi:hypothetical protein